MNAARVTTRQPGVASPTVSVREVARLPVRHGISAVPVVDASGALPGIASVLMVSVVRRSREIGILHAVVLIGDGTERLSLFHGYLLGAGIMVLGGIIALVYGVDAEGKDPEDLAIPLPRVDAPRCRAGGSLTGAARWTTGPSPR